MDVNSAYFRPNIMAEIYLEQPSGVEKVDESTIKLVCRLNNSVYGFKQATKNQNDELANFFFEQNFVRSRNDYHFNRENEKGIKLFILSWFDNLVIPGSSLEAIEELKKR